MGSYCIRLFLESDEAEARKVAQELLTGWARVGSCRIDYITRYWKIQSRMEVVFRMDSTTASLTELGMELGVSWNYVSEGEVMWKLDEVETSKLVPSLRWAHIYDLNYL